MAEHESGQEKTEEPSEKRLKDAREKGQVARSKELNTMLSLLAASIAAVFLGGALVEDLSAILAAGLHPDPRLMIHKESILPTIGALAIQALYALGPFFAILMLSVFVGPIVMGGWSFSLKALVPKLDKLDPFKGFGRIFSVKGLMEFLKAILKTLLVGAVAILIISFSIQELIMLGLQSVELSLNHAASILLGGFIALSLVLGLIAAIDVPFQLWQHTTQLRMTKQEVRDELKDSEGRPEVRGRIKMIQRELAGNRMMEAIPFADVIITNPTHYAVALKYSDSNMGAPTLVAKGQNLLAARIRELAQENDVPIFEAPPLARALYGMVELNQQIPETLYLSVAQILAYIFQIRDLNPYVDQKPAPPSKFEVPAKYEDETL